MFLQVFSNEPNKTKETGNSCKNYFKAYKMKNLRMKPDKQALLSGNHGRRQYGLNFKDTTYWGIYEKIFQFHKRFCNTKTFEEWEAATTEAGALCKSYRDMSEHIFVKDLLVTILNEIERSSKQNEVNQDDRQ